MRAFGWTCLAAIACTGDPPGDDKTGDTGAPTETGTDSGTIDTQTTPPTECASSFSGSIARSAAPLAGANIRFCRGELCRYATTDGDGSYSFGNVPPDWHSFEVVGGDGLATALVPLLFDCASTRTVDVEVLPLDAESPLGPSAEEHAVGTGLYLTVAADELEPPLFGDPATAVAGVRVPEAAWIPFDGIEGTVLAMWYLSPFDYHSVPAGGLPIRITNEWGLADGTALEVYVGSYTESRWLPAGTATASGPDLTGAALPVLSTVILVQPPAAR